MGSDEVPKVIIRHVVGAKANQVEEISLVGRTEVRFGRDPSSDIAFDSPSDDAVSRSHAIIRCESREPLVFTIEDLGSTNGTYLNKQPLKQKSELLPEDVVTFGRNGPSFTFDVTPRPANLAARTRVIDTRAAGATRVLNAAETTAMVTARDTKVGTRATSFSVATDEPPPVPRDAETKESVGRATMLNEIARERSANNRMWMGVVGGVVALAAVAGGLLYWKQVRSERAQVAAVQQIRRAAEDQSNEAAKNLQRQLGLGAQDIVRKFGPSTAKVTVQWRLYDQRTGQPIFIKTVEYKKKRYALFVKTSGGDIVPWLTPDAEESRNVPIEANISGTAFVASENGFLLTNKHLAAAWQLPFFDSLQGFEREGIVIEQTGNKKDPLKFSVMDLGSEEAVSLKSWVPGRKSVYFLQSDQRVIGQGSIPDPRSGGEREYIGRNDAMVVRFAGSRVDINATLVRTSNESDAALIKIDSPQALQKAELSDAEPSVGESVIVLGYPAIAAKTYAISQTVLANGTVKPNTDLVPQPFVTEGIVAQVSTKLMSDKGVTMVSDEGNTMRLTINSAGPGNSGGPVFNSSGKVIGIFTFTITGRNATGSGAIPIQYGSELFKSQ